MWVWVSSSFVLNGCESGCKIPPMGMAGRLSEMKQVRSGSATLPMGAQRVTEYKDRLHNQATSSRVPHIWPSPIQTLRLSGMPSSATLTISAPSLIACHNTKITMNSAWHCSPAMSLLASLQQHG
jgi:hypothetical protein